MSRILGSALALFVCSASLHAQTLPEVGPVDWAHLRDNTRRLLRTMDEAKVALPEKTTQALRELLNKESADADGAATAVQKLLEAHCLIAVSINPESRVKAARGPAAAVLRLDTDTVVLVRVHNEGGVTSTLAVSGPGLNAGKQEGGAWLHATILSRAALSGHGLEYIPLRLTAREVGKREATFCFDVGQGTQDLGFRAEVPVLFTVKKN